MKIVLEVGSKSDTEVTEEHWLASVRESVSHLTDKAYVLEEKICPQCWLTCGILPAKDGGV